MMRRNHAAWVAYWSELPGGQFIPFLDLWFSRSYYDHAPADAAIASLRKEPVKIHSFNASASPLRTIARGVMQSRRKI